MKKKLAAKFGNIDKKFHELRALILPININQTHWIIVQVDFRFKTFVFCDSMNCHIKKAKGIKDVICKVLDPYWKSEFKSEYLPSIWKISFAFNPKQKNSDDCGLAVCLNALQLTRFISDNNLKVENQVFTY